MPTVPQRIANAFAVLCGRYGDVTAMAKHAISRGNRSIARPKRSSRPLLDLEGLRWQPWRLSAETRAWALARTVQLTKASLDWQEDASRIRSVLRSAWRASLVECVNSVARMQQARHRKMTQGLMDLKRLYWNLRELQTGRRKGQTPYGLLGLGLPELSLGEFLKLTPAELRKELSGQEVTP